MIERLVKCVALLGVLAITACDRQAPSSGAGADALDPLAVLQASVDDSVFASATSDTAITFPRDHGPHADYRTEWWYVTGNLKDEQNRRYGYQLTFFRNAIAAAAPQVDSHWATNQVYMAHFAVTDGAVFFNRERFARGALGLSGATATPFGVWLEDWTLREVEGTANSCEGCLTLTLSAGIDDVALTLELVSEKPRVLQGDDGFSVKSERTQTASHYYSLTRLTTRGTLRLGESSHAVHGSSWFDREWSTSSLADDQTGWDWFALQTFGDEELMIYRLRLADGQPDRASAGVIVDTTGVARHLGVDEFSLTPTDHWTSEISGARYPVAWRVEVPGESIDLTLTSLMPAQEHTGIYRYWEGAVDFEGQWRSQPVSGWGYVELTGYR